MNLETVIATLDAAAVDYRTWAQLTRQRTDLTETTRNDNAADYQARAANCATASSWLQEHVKPKPE